MIFVCAALIIGFILGAFEGRAAVAKAQEIAKAADTEAEAIKDATAHAVARLHAFIEAEDHDLVAHWARIVAKLRSTL